jgi:hypothetical protein
MAEKPRRPQPHPDDFMLVSVALEFRAKLNPEANDPPPFEATAIEYTPPAAEAAEYLESVARAIRERRLYGFLQQQCAQSAVGAREWIRKTTEEALAEAYGEEAKQKFSDDGKLT